MLKIQPHGGVPGTRQIKGSYSKEFRNEAAKSVVEGGVSAYEASRRFSLPKPTLENWARAFRAGRLGNIGGQRRPLVEIELELERVGPGQPGTRHPKKAAAYFAKEGLPPSLRYSA